MAKEMDLTPIERLGLMGVLGEKQKGNRAIFKMINTLSEDLSFQQEEIERLGMIIDGTRIEIPPSVATTTERFTIPDTLFQIIKKDLETMEEHDQLPRECTSLMDKVEGKIEI